MQKQIIEDCIIFQHAPIVGHGGKQCILNHREDFVEFANSNDVEAVFAGHTHGNYKFGEEYPDKIGDETGEIDDPDPIFQNSIPLDWYPVYMEIANST